MASVKSETAAGDVESKSTKRNVTFAAPTPGGARGIAISDLVLRLSALAAALAATAGMGTTNESLPFFTRFFQFQAQYQDIPTFIYFVIANAIISGYLLLSLPFSIIAIARPHKLGIKLLLLITDTVAVAFTMAAASAAAAIVYLAHNGNAATNWFAICQQYGAYCKSSSGAVVGSLVAAAILILLVVLSAVALRRHGSS